MCFDHEMFFAGPWTVWALGTRMNQEPLRQTSFFIPFPCEFLGISTASKDKIELVLKILHGYSSR